MSHNCKLLFIMSWVAASGRGRSSVEA